MRAAAYWYLCAEHAEVAAGLPALRVSKLADVLAALDTRGAPAILRASDNTQKAV